MASVTASQLGNAGIEMNASSKATKPLQFVSVRPNERRRWLGSTNVVRSAAARHQWKESKDVNPRGRKSKITRRSVSQGEAIEYCANDISNGAALLVASATQSTSTDQYMIHVASESPPSPLPMLTYNYFPTDLPREIMGSLFCSICRLAPQVCGSYNNSNAPTELIRHCLSTSANFHACVLPLTLLQADTFDGSSVQSHAYRKIVEQCRMIAIAETRELLDKVTTTMYERKSDDLQLLLSIVLAMWCQTGHNEASTSVLRSSGPRQAPFQNLEVLDRLGPTIGQNMHTNAALRLIDLSGGIDAVAEHNRLNSSSFFLILATKTHQKSSLPCRTNNADFEEVFESCRIHLLGEPRRSSNKLVQDVVGIGSKILSKLLPVIDDLRLCVSMTDDLLRRNSGALPHPSYLSDARKWTQHKLVSLPTLPDLKLAGAEPLQQLRLYEVIRLGFHIFSLLAVYPLPVSAAPFPALAAALAFQIKPHLESALGQRMQHLSLWLSTMGAIAALGRPERSRFVNVIRIICHAETIKSWTDFRSILEGYLWDSEVSDFDGRVVWIEVERPVT